MSSQSKRYAPMHVDHVSGFPNCMPQVDWKTYLPKFRDGNGDDATLHLIRFHMHVRKLKIRFHEDCLMKIFMATLEGKARSWYERFPLACMYSLKDFHSIFFEKYRESYPSFLLIEDCCYHFENFIQELESAYDDEEFMDDEILDDLNENPFHHHEKIMDSTLDDIELEKNFSKDDSDLPSSKIGDNLQQSCFSFSAQDTYDNGYLIFPLLLDEDPNFELVCIKIPKSHHSSIEFESNEKQQHENAAQDHGIKRVCDIE
jgi:hypothetical protein